MFLRSKKAGKVYPFRRVCKCLYVYTLRFSICSSTKTNWFFLKSLFYICHYWRLFTIETESIMGCQRACCMISIFLCHTCLIMFRTVLNRDQQMPDLLLLLICASIFFCCQSSCQHCSFLQPPQSWKWRWVTPLSCWAHNSPCGGNRCGSGKLFEYLFDIQFKGYIH